MTMTPKEQLFQHINSYWLSQLASLREKPSAISQAVEQLYNQILDRLPDSITKEDWREGALLGASIAQHYRISGYLEFVEKSHSEWFDVFEPSYCTYLQSHIHAWAVPLSYNYIFDTTLCGIDKTLNLWGSSQSHHHYFDSLLEMVVTHLAQNTKNLPVGIMDIGCGDGSLLRRLKLRLEQEFSQSFAYIGVDIDVRSIQIATQNNSDNIVFLQGDVADPDTIDRTLRERQLPSLDNYLHVRAFVDHNCQPFTSRVQVDNFEDPNYYFLYRNELISATSVVDAFRLHFIKWKKYIRIHGLCIIELHSTDCSTLTESPSIAYEIFHLLSEQYMLPYDKYRQLCEDAGYELLAVKLFPIENPNVSVSLYS